MCTYVIIACGNVHSHIFTETYVVKNKEEGTCVILAWADQSWNARSKCHRTRVGAAMGYGV